MVGAAAGGGLAGIAAHSAMSTTPVISNSRWAALATTLAELTVAITAYEALDGDGAREHDEEQ